MTRWRKQTGAPDPVVVVGAGPAGLAVTHELTRRGVPVLLVDENDRLGSSWRSRYDSMKLNSVRWLSDLPGMPMPRSYGRWVRRDDLARYFEAYGRRLNADIRTGLRAQCITVDGDRWRVATTGGDLLADDVVVATGMYHTPVIPPWPGLAEHRDRVLHSTQYRSAADFEGRDVLVVGAGSSGAEIAVDLTSRRSGRVRVAVRTPPNIMPRQLLGVPLQPFAVLNRGLPNRVQDVTGRLVAWLAFGDLGRTPLGRNPEGMFTHLARTGVAPTVDDGFVAAVRAGRIEVVGEVVAVTPTGVRLRGGEQVAVDVVIAATGFRSGLEGLVGQLGVLDDKGLPPQYGWANRSLAEQGLHFVGFAAPLSGHLREIVVVARRTARRIARRRAARGQARPAVPPAPDIIQEHQLPRRG